MWIIWWAGVNRRTLLPPNAAFLYQILVKVEFPFPQYFRSSTSHSIKALGQMMA
jgi:hypothetical protein